MQSHMDLLHQKVFIHLLCHVCSYKVSTTTHEPEGQRGYCRIDRSLWYFLWGIWRHSPCRHSSVLKKSSVFLPDQLDALSSFFDPTHCVIQPSDPPLEMLYSRSHVTVRWCLTWETHVNPFVSNAGLLIGRLLEAVLLLNNSMRAIKPHLVTIGNINHVCTLVIYSTLLMDQCWTIHGLTLCLHYDPFNINLMIHVYAL